MSQYICNLKSNLRVTQGLKVANECQSNLNGEKKVHVNSLDLTSIQSIEECCKELSSQVQRIDYLINNAG